MLGPKSSGRPQRLVAGSGGCSSSLKKPAVATSSRSGAASCSNNSTASNSRAQSTATLRQSSQSSLSAGTGSVFGGGGGNKSTSRCSITSDTTASVCSSSACSRFGSSQQATATGGLIKGKTTTTTTRAASTSLKSSSSGLPTAANATYNRTTSGLASTSRLKSGPSSTASSLSSSTTAVGSSNTSSNQYHHNGQTVSSCSTAAAARRVPTLAMSLRDKDQQIKLLIKERDEQKFQAELMASRAEQWEEKFVQSELEKSHVTSEADDEVIELRRLAQELEDENKRLAERLAAGEQVIGDTQFKLDELEIESRELRKSLAEKEEQLATMEQEHNELLAGGKTASQVTTERAISKQKYEREIENLKEKIISRDEQMIQLRTSLEMRKNEVTNLQSVAGDLERKLKIESERSERHLKRIDEINLELKASEAKLATKNEENEMYEKQVKQLRQDLRTAEEKLEQISLARKKDVDILHNKLSAARRGSTTPTSPQPYKTPTPQDEIVRLQMEIRDLKDQLIDREAELDCNRRDIEVMRRKMETRTLEVDCNNQELARRCQDLLEQNRQSEDTVKQLLRSTTEHSAQLMRATEDLKEANGKCINLRDEINKLEAKLDDELRKSSSLTKENNQIREENDELREQVDLLRQQVASLNGQLSDLCEQLDVQTDNLHKDREALANQLSQNEIDSAQLRHNLATAKQDLRTSKLQTQEVSSERDRLKADLGMKEKYIRSRNDIIETLRHELDDCKKSLMEYKLKIEELRQTSQEDSEQISRDLKAQLETLKREIQLKNEECGSLRVKCEQLQKSLEDSRASNEKEQEDELKKFDEMRQKHSAELDTLKGKLQDLEDQLEEAKSSTLKRDSSVNNNKSESTTTTTAATVNRSQANENEQAASNDREQQQQQSEVISKQKKEDYETQIEFLNSVVVDMQRKCDDYKNRLAQIETLQIMNEFDNIILSNQPTLSRASTLLRSNNNTSSNTSSSSNNNNNNNNNNNSSNDNFIKEANNNATLKRAPQKSKMPLPPPPPPPPQAQLTPIINTSFASTTLGRPNNNNHSVHFECSVPEKPARISGRPYCDICNVFDIHHTVYCPKVSEKLASRHQMVASDGVVSNNNNNNNNININNNNNNNNNCETPNVDELFREYEQSIETATIHRQFSSLRRPQGAEKPPRPYCDHCDLFGHTIKSCNSLKV